MSEVKILNIKPNQLEIDIKKEMDAGKTIEEATKIVHERYQKEQDELKALLSE
jgi:hypothetical protein